MWQLLYNFGYNYSNGICHFVRFDKNNSKMEIFRPQTFCWAQRSVWPIKCRCWRCEQCLIWTQQSLQPSFHDTWSHTELHDTLPRVPTSFRYEVLPQDTSHLIRRPCYQRGSPCQDPADNRTTRRPLDHSKEKQTAVVWSCIPVIRSGPNHHEDTVKGGGDQADRPSRLRNR